MSLKEYSLSSLRTQLKKDPYFVDVYSKLINSSPLANEEALFILRIAIDFMRMEDKDCSYFGYSIILRYSISTSDYKPLYDVALANNYMPIVDLVDRYTSKSVESEAQNLNHLIVESLKEAFTDHARGIVKSEGQLRLDEFSRKNENFAIVAPTSYGKSELIVDKTRRLFDSNKNICILVPTKALVAQTKKSLRNAGLKDIVSHPDMYLEQKFANRGFVSVLTQERLLGLFSQHPNLKLDYLFVDEAHKILDGDNRSIAISQCILIARSRNESTVVDFFTPFLSDASSITLIDDQEPKDYRVSERMKVERYRYLDWGSQKSYTYDQFLDTAIPSVNFKAVDAVNFIRENAGSKNIIYLNTPKQVVRFANDLCDTDIAFESTSDIEKWIAAISDYTDEDYDLVACLKKGIVYHHGGIPDIIKMYLESIYSSGVTGVRFLVTTSTLLEGVNIPADKLFILNSGLGGGALSSASLRNLSGRISRFKEVFSKNNGSPGLLEPSVYLVNHRLYERGTLRNPYNFYSKNVKLGVDVEDEVNNPLLVNVKTSEHYRRNKELVFLNNLETGYMPQDHKGPVVESEIAKLCFKHNVRDFDIIENEFVLNTNLNSYNEKNLPQPLTNSSQVIDAIHKIFLNDVNLNTIAKNKEVPISTIKNSTGARKYYSMFYDWSVNYKSFKFMVGKLMKYWESRDKSHLEYVGYLGELDSYGNRNEQNGLHYVYIKQKNRAEKVNMAISKVKLSQDFADTHLNKYVDILYDLGMVGQEYYNLLRYHTNDSDIILLRKQGVTFDLAKLVMKKYSEFVDRDESGLIVFRNIELMISEMQKDNVNDILLFEAENFL